MQPHDHVVASNEVCFIFDDNTTSINSMSSMEMIGVGLVEDDKTIRTSLEQCIYV